jgi:hypothetical protein
MISALFCVAVLGLGSSHGLATAASPGPSETPTTARLRIGSFNTSATLAHGRAIADITALANEVDILSLQEMASAERRTGVRAALVDCENCGFEMFVPDGGPVPAGTPILYRRDRFALLASGSLKVTEDTYVGERGAGPSTIRAKYVNWVRLKDLESNRLLYVFNNHTVPTVQKSSGGPNDLVRRQEIYRKHMAGLTRLITGLRAETGGMVFVTGDFNVNFRTDRRVATSYFPYAALGRLKIRAGYQRLSEPAIGTHILPSGFDKRLIDYVSIFDHSAFVPVSQLIIKTFASDHRPTLLTLSVKIRPLPTL